MDELTLDDKIYISSKKAAQITGYAKDYVGQLCREGQVDARMVGRNWYVLEDSIRAHRFGVHEAAAADTAKEPEVALPEPVVTPAPVERTWEKPSYVTEVPVMVPELAPKPEYMPVKAAPAVEDMQQAWEEWFTSRKGEGYLETPEILDSREPGLHPQPAAEGAPQPESDEEPVSIQMLVPAEAHKPTMTLHFGETPQPVEESWGGEEVSIPIRHATDAAMTRTTPSAAEERLTDIDERVTRFEHARPVRASGRGTSKVAVTLLLIVIAVSIVTAYLGSGYSEKYQPRFVNNNVITKYLGGTR